MKHKQMNEIKLGRNEEFTEDIFPDSRKCPNLMNALMRIIKESDEYENNN